MLRQEKLVFIKGKSNLELSSCFSSGAEGSSCGWQKKNPCRPVAKMELTSEDAVLLLIASENVHLKLKRERGGVHEINQLRGHYGEYHHTLPQLSR